MLKKTKSIIVLGLVVIMIMTMAVGCSGGAKDPVNGDDPTSEPSSEPSGEPTGDQTLKNEKTEKLVLFMPFANTSTAEGMEETAKALEDAMKDSVNVTLDWIVIPRDNFEEVLNVTLVSGDQLDGGVGDMDDLGTASSKKGLVMPIDDLLAQYGKNLTANVPQEAWDSVKNSSKETVGIPSYNRNYWQGAVIRQDWLDELGLKMPTTLDELEATMEAFKNMEGDIIPISGAPWVLEAVLMSAVTGNVSPAVDGFWDTLDPTGEKVINGFTHPEWKKFLELYHKWLDNGWLNKDFNIADDAQNEQMFTSGKLGIMFMDPHSADRYEQLLKTVDENAKVGYLPIPSGPAGEAAFPMNTGVSRVVWVNQNGPHPERVIQYFDWMVANQENYMLAKFGVENTQWVKKGDQWALPESAQGDPTKRTYYDVYAPLEYEFLTPVWADAPAINAEIDNYYRSLPSIKNPLYGFTADMEAISGINTIDIWGEMYSIAQKARPITDYEVLVEEFNKSGGSEIYDELSRQFQEWKASQK